MEHTCYEVVFWAYKKTFCGPRSEDVATRFFNEQTQPCKLVQVVVGPVKTARVVVGKK
jgi:uncharacterized protein (DUF2236 family)